MCVCVCVCVCACVCACVCVCVAVVVVVVVSNSKTLFYKDCTVWVSVKTCLTTSLCKASVE